MKDAIFDNLGKAIPVEAFHPGEFLLEEIEYRQLIKEDVAEQLGILPQQLSDICSGKQNITAQLALKLAETFSISAAYWMNLQAAWDMQEAQSLNATKD